MKVTKPVLWGFASLSLIGAILLDPILAIIAILIFIITLGR